MSGMCETTSKSLLFVDDLGLAVDNNLQRQHGKMKRIWGDARCKPKTILVRLMKVMKAH
jgi:hypothetical protein